MFPVWVTYIATHGSQRLYLPIADHADPAAFVPSIETMAAHAEAVVRALLPDRPPP